MASVMEPNTQLATSLSMAGFLLSCKDSVLNRGWTHGVIDVDFMSNLYKQSVMDGATLSGVVGLDPMSAMEIVAHHRGLVVYEEFTGPMKSVGRVLSRLSQSAMDEGVACILFIMTGDQRSTGKGWTRALCIAGKEGYQYCLIDPRTGGMEMSKNATTDMCDRVRELGSEDTYFGAIYIKMAISIDDDDDDDEVVPTTSLAAAKQHGGGGGGKGKEEATAAAEDIPPVNKRKAVHIKKEVDPPTIVDLPPPLPPPPIEPTVVAVAPRSRKKRKVSKNKKVAK